MSAAREDLLHLSPEALAQAANLGLVKRAARELEGGYRPSLNLDEAGTLTATFSDGVVTVWEAEKPIQNTRCSCGAATVCRHRIMAALAYRAEAEQAPAPPGSPAGVGDDVLARLIPPRLLALAEAQRMEGLAVEIRHAAGGEPCPTARLPAATVRFWGGAAIEAARCDCVQAACCEHVALAVWAFREAERRAPAAPAANVRLGEAAPAAVADAAPYGALVETLVHHGVKRGMAPHLQSLTRALEAAEQTGAVWLRLLLGELEAWLGAYAARSARYGAAEGFRLIAELGLRLAAGGRPGRAKTALGIGEAGEVELDRLRLISLGCRIDRDGDTRTARQILADGDTGTRFVLAHTWRMPEGAADELAVLANQRLAPGVKLVPLAGGQLLSQQARRRADGTLTLAKARSSQNSLLPQAGDWSALGRPLCFDRVADLRMEKQSNPIPQITPRHAAGHFVVLRAANLETLFYDANEQALIGVVCDSEGETVILKRTHQGHVRHALDAAAGALSGRFGPLSHVAGVLSWEHGQAYLEPWALACGRVVVPDIEPACGVLAGLPLGTASEPERSGLARALAELETELAALLHHGLVDLGSSWCERGQRIREQLRSLSLFVLAEALGAVIAEVRLSRANPGGGRLSAALLHLAGLAVLHREASACPLPAGM
jgi:hypothetical protein